MPRLGEQRGSVGLDQGPADRLRRGEDDTFGLGKSAPFAQRHEVGKVRRKVCTLDAVDRHLHRAGPRQLGDREMAGGAFEAPRNLGRKGQAGP